MDCGGNDSLFRRGLAWLAFPIFEASSEMVALSVAVRLHSRASSLTAVLRG
jgi:hypothetical protein